LAEDTADSVREGLYLLGKALLVLPDAIKDCYGAEQDI